MLGLNAGAGRADAPSTGGLPAVSFLVNGGSKTDYINTRSGPVVWAWSDAPPPSEEGFWAWQNKGKTKPVLLTIGFTVEITRWQSSIRLWTERLPGADKNMTGRCIWRVSLPNFEGDFTATELYQEGASSVKQLLIELAKLDNPSY